MSQPCPSPSKLMLKAQLEQALRNIEEMKNEKEEADEKIKELENEKSAYQKELSEKTPKLESANDEIKHLKSLMEATVKFMKLDPAEQKIIMKHIEELYNEGREVLLNNSSSAEDSE